MKLNTLYELCETVSHELAEVNEKIQRAGNELSAGDLELLDKLTHTMKSIKTTIAMIEAEENGYSGRYWDGRYYYDGEPGMEGTMNRDGRASNARGRGSNAKRDAMGRYSRGYSRAEAKEEIIDELEELMEKAPDEHTRKKLERFIGEMK